MANSKQVNEQYQFKPDFSANAKKTADSHGFKNFFTKKKAWLILAVLVICLTVIAAFYFSRAAERPSFYFALSSNPNPQPGALRLTDGYYYGDQVSIDLYIEYGSQYNGGDFSAGSVISGFDLNVNYSVNGDPGNLSSDIIFEVEPSLGSNSFSATDSSFSMSAQNLFIADKLKVATLILRIPENARFIELFFAGENKVTIDQREGNEPRFVEYDLLPDDLYLFELNSQPRTEPYVFLEPALADIYLGQPTEVGLYVKNQEDIVALGIEFEYNNQLIEVQVLESETFPVIGNETTNKNSYTLIRGTYGNGTTADGTLSPQTDRRGFNSGLNSVDAGLVATLRIRPISLTDEDGDNRAIINITNVQAILDDGLGTVDQSSYGVDSNLNEGIYTIKQEPAFADILQILDHGYICTPIDTGYHLNIFWQTNLATYPQLTVTGGSGENLNAITDIDPNTAVTNHSINLTDLSSATGFYQITASDPSEQRQNITTEQIGFDCTFEYGDLTIRDLVVTPYQDGTADVVFITTGGPNRGRATGNISNLTPAAGSSSPTTTTNTNVHRFSLNSLAENTSYQIEVGATSGSQQATDSLTFITPINTSMRLHNTVLKVERDRVCDTWLYCRSAVEIVNNKKQKENLCFDVGLCQRLDENGNCISPVNIGEQGITGGNQTFSSPQMVYEDGGETAAINMEEKFKNLSGLSKVGMMWSDDIGFQGYRNYAAMTPIGKSVNLYNGDLELGDVWPWQPNGAGQISLTRDVNEISNTVLQISRDLEKKSDYAGARIPLGNLTASDRYVISFDARASSPGKHLYVQAKTGSNSYLNLFDPILLGQGFQRIVRTIDFNLPSGYTELVFNQFRLDPNNPQAGEDFNKPFYIDNVSMKPLLQVQDAEAPLSEPTLVARDCRLYPATNAPECDYTQIDNGRHYSGWKGFCVEVDPKNSNRCLNWYPVDIIAGETDVFGADAQVGYTDRKPLYYCLESAGNYPYYDKEVVKNNIPLYGGETESFSYDLSYLKLRKDEIVKLEIKGIKIASSALVAGRFDCGLANDDSKINPSVPTDASQAGVSGSIVFNQINSDHWDDSLSSTQKKCSSDYSTTYNQYAYLRCAHVEGHDNDCNIVTARLEFNDQNYLQAVQIKWHDGSEGSGQFNFDSINVTFIGERCNLLAQVVDPYGNNYAWSSRILAGGWSANNNLKYTYNQDYMPYGAAVPPEDVNQPQNWQQPLYVMPPDKQFGRAPYQARAGAPYSIKGIQGDEIHSQCIAGSQNSLGKSCVSNANCGYDDQGQPGLCVGFEATDHQNKILPFGYQEGIKNLSQLFVRGLNVWYWNPNEDRYVQVCSHNYSVDCSQLTTAETREMCVNSARVCWDFRAGRGQAPTISNITINNRPLDTIELTAGQTRPVVLRFNAVVNENQLPLRAIRVFWGDGQMTDLTNLHIAPRTENDNPHVLLHTYSCENVNGCDFVPEIQIEDNWGICNNKSGTDLCPTLSF